MSSVIIGFGRRTTKYYGEVAALKCIRCSNHVHYRLTHIRTWFTYFFIPIFPYRSEYRVACPICSYSISLRGKEIEAAKQGTLRLYVLHD
jgi:ribosomal protein S26